MPDVGAYLSTGLSRYPPQPVDPCDGTARASERGTVMTYPIIHDMESVRAHQAARLRSPSHRHGSSLAILLRVARQNRSVEQPCRPR